VEPVVSEGSSRNWIDRMGASKSGSPGSSLPPGMAEPAQSGGPDDYTTQLSLKEEQLVDGIEHRRVMLAAVESGAELERCRQMLDSFGPLERMEARIAELQRRVHRSGTKRPATFGGFYLGRSQEERELQDLIRRLDVAHEMRARAERLGTDRAGVKAEYEREIRQLEHRLDEMRARRARNPRA
jgi:hypothetical protein